MHVCGTSRTVYEAGLIISSQGLPEISVTPTFQLLFTAITWTKMYFKLSIYFVPYLALAQRTLTPSQLHVLAHVDATFPLSLFHLEHLDETFNKFLMLHPLAWPLFVCWCSTSAFGRASLPHPRHCFWLLLCVQFFFGVCTSVKTFMNPRQ